MKHLWRQLWVLALVVSAQAGGLKGSSGSGGVPRVPPHLNLGGPSNQAPAGFTSSFSSKIPGIPSAQTGPATPAPLPASLPASPAALDAGGSEKQKLPAGPGSLGEASCLGQGLHHFNDSGAEQGEGFLRSAWDGASKFHGGPEGEAAELSSVPTTEGFLDAELAKARQALRRGHEDIPAALQAVEVIAWSRPYLDGAGYDRWIHSRRYKIQALDKRLSRTIKENIEAELAAGDFAGARERLEELELRHSNWARAHEELFAPLRQALPAEELKAEPQSPASEPDHLAELMRSHLAAGEFRQAEYLATILERKHPEWVSARAEEISGARQAVLKGIYEAFEAKKAQFSPAEARRLADYASAAAEGRNLGFGFKQPAKQDPESLMCTIMSICNAFEATIGFADPGMDLEKFTELVRTILKDPSLGAKKGLSTHRVRTLMQDLGYKLKVIEMQERLRRPFREEELVRLIRPGQALIPVFIIAQSYPDEEGLQREEHKVFLRDAFYSPAENRWIYLVMDPLIGRVSFYSWPELKVFLHKIFVIKTDKPLAAPKPPESGGKP